MDYEALGVVFTAALVLVGAAVAAMALGSRLTGRCLRGSCGGPALRGPDGEPADSCAHCPNRGRGEG